MTIEVRVPQLPESVADATLVSWHKKPGDSVARDENLVDLETDKVVLEVPAPAAGVLKEIKLQDGTTVTSGQLLAIIEEGAAARRTGGRCCCAGCRYRACCRHAGRREGRREIESGRKARRRREQG